MNFKHQESKQKLRGGYYTPQLLADLLSQWALSDKASTILEPSCGDGRFLHAIYNQLVASNESVHLSIDAVEIEPEESAKAEEFSSNLRRIGVDVRVVNDDVFHWLGNGNSNKKWDAIIGNPPYIRYQYFEKSQREIAEDIFRMANVPFSKRTNAWVPLVIASIMHLVPGGRLAMVIPSELLHIQHAGGLRQLLDQEMETITLINIREMVFTDVLQGVVLLLGIKRQDREFMPLMHQEKQQLYLLAQPTGESAKLRILDYDKLDNLSQLDLLTVKEDTEKNINPVNGEWMFGLLTEEEGTFVNKLKARSEVLPFASIANVDIGIVTGANDYFVVNEKTKKQYELETICAPMLGKSNLIKGITYTLKDHEVNAQADKSVYLLSFPEKMPADLPTSMVNYIRLGERLQLQTRYKCRIRDPWYVVPYVWASEISLLKRSHLFPRLVLNELRAYSTDTAYRICLLPPYLNRARDLVFSFLNSLTFLCAEFEGRHYGGGVLELVPSEVEKLLIPLISISENEFAHIDSIIRTGASLDEIVNYTDHIVLGEGLGLTSEEIALIRKAHRRLMKRRLRRPE